MCPVNLCDWGCRSFMFRSEIDQYKLIFLLGVSHRQCHVLYRYHLLSTGDGQVSSSWASRLVETCVQIFRAQRIRLKTGARPRIKESIFDCLAVMELIWRCKVVQSFAANRHQVVRLFCRQDCKCHQEALDVGTRDPCLPGDILGRVDWRGHSSGQCFPIPHHFCWSLFVSSCWAWLYVKYQIRILSRGYCTTFGIGFPDIGLYHWFGFAVAGNILCAVYPVHGIFPVHFFPTNVTPFARFPRGNQQEKSTTRKYIPVWY